MHISVILDRFLLLFTVLEMSLAAVVLRPSPPLRQKCCKTWLVRFARAVSPESWNEKSAVHRRDQGLHADSIYTRVKRPLRPISKVPSYDANLSNKHPRLCSYVQLTGPAGRVAWLYEFTPASCSHAVKIKEGRNSWQASWRKWYLLPKYIW